MPEISPVPGSRLRPSGRAPAVIDQYRGAAPPVDVSSPVKPTPCVPLGSDGGVRVRALPDAATFTVKVAAATLPPLPELSVAVIVNVCGPATVGVPVMAPLDGSRLRPSGSAPPVTDHVYGAIPPAAETVPKYCNPTVGSPSALVSMTTGGGVPTVTDKSASAVCEGELESVAVMAKTDVPVVVGVPEIIPVDASRLSPGGRVPLVTDQLKGAVPPSAQRKPEYGTDTVPSGTAVPTVREDIGSFVANDLRDPP